MIARLSVSLSISYFSAINFNFVTYVATVPANVEKLSVQINNRLFISIVKYDNCQETKMFVLEAKYTVAT